MAEPLKFEKPEPVNNPHLLASLLIGPGVEIDPTYKVPELYTYDPDRPIGTWGTNVQAPTTDELLGIMDKFKAMQKETDETMVRALVDLVNQSPHSPGWWAQRLGILLPEFINVCDELEPPNQRFRDIVYSYLREVLQTKKPW